MPHWRKAALIMVYSATALIIGCTAKPQRAKIDNALIRLGFDLAVMQEALLPDQKAICLSYRVMPGAERDTPADIVTAMGKQLGRPAFPVSACGFDESPFVRASRDRAMLYTLEFTTDKAGNAEMVIASAVFGNLGAEGEQFRLHRQDGKWRAERMGLKIFS